MRSVLSALPEGPILVAVSGGSDSVALLHLLYKWAQRPLTVATVDHGLRAESAQEAEFVARLCANLDLAHQTCLWTGPKMGNVQALARDARRALLSQAAQAAGAATIALGHTLDDQAETFLLRLARGSGVDGLSAMSPLRQDQGVTWARPLLHSRRSDLQAFLREIGQNWIDDPSNEDETFDRVRFRKAASMLSDLGLGAERLAATADRMGLAREALGQVAQDLARTCARPHVLGHLELDLPPLAHAPRETALRVLATALTWVTGTRYRPRFSSLKPVLNGMCEEAQGASTLHGAQMRWREGRAILFREASKMAQPRALPGCWDNRFECSGEGADLLLGPLGTALNDDLNWRASGLSREVLAVSPALWQGQRLVAHPTLSPNPAHIFRHTCGIEAFFESFLSR